MFEPMSRYANIETATLETSGAEGRLRIIVYKRRRFIPAAEGQTTLAEHSVAQGDRLDNLTARYLGDPTQFWRVCDTNVVLHPAELEEVGRTVNIGLPQG